MRNVMRAPFYQEICPTRLQRDRQKVGHFVTNFGGAVIATSVNGLIAGIGADHIFADDLLSLRDANDPIKVEAVNRIFDAEITSRLNTPSEGRIVVTAHRLHENDLSAHLKGAARTKLIVLPLVAARASVFGPASGYAKKASSYEPDHTPKRRLRSYDLTQFRALRTSTSKASGDRSCGCLRITSGPITHCSQLGRSSLALIPLLRRAQTTASRSCKYGRHDTTGFI